MNARGDRGPLPGDDPPVVHCVAGGDEVVERGQAHRGRDGDEMAAPEPADVALNPTLLVSHRSGVEALDRAAAHLVPRCRLDAEVGAGRGIVEQVAPE